MDSEDSKKSPEDMTVFQSRFQTMSQTIVTKIDEMGNRFNELDQSITELKTEMNGDGSKSPKEKT